MADVNRKRKRIWVLIKRLDRIGNNVEDVPAVTEDIMFDAQCVPDVITAGLYKTFNLDQNLVLKLRNHRGSLVPINNRLEANTKSYPYTLDVVTKHQTVTATSRSQPTVKTEEALEVAYNAMKDRIIYLETELPNLKNRRIEQLQEEAGHMSDSLDFLNTRLKSSEDSNWQGMFKKCPLW